jgi:pimeloyl-ACP methyl ester carboxylesterase
MRVARLVVGLIAAVGFAGPALNASQPLQIAGSTCAAPPVLHCPDANCPGDVVTSGGPVIESTSGRNYFLDYPCDLNPAEPVTFILSLHGGGSYGNWQRHYFPLLDYVAKHRLVVATPFSPRRVWTAEDDAYLQNIVSTVITDLGAGRIKAFWLVGHSQGGATSTRLVCTDFFRTKVDGLLSLSGGRLGGAATRAANAGPAPVNRSSSGPGAAAGAGIARAALTPPSPPTCDFSHIYTTGEHEIAALPAASARADMYGCSAKDKGPDIIDIKPGYVYDRTRQNPGTRQWGLLPRPGKAEVSVYQNCRDGRVVADVVRIDKGHTEGLEPNVTERLISLMLSARGGKISAAAPY